MVDLITVPEEKSTKEDVSLKSKPKEPQKEFKVPKVRLAKGISAYDKKIKNKVYTKNPYDYNEVSLKKETTRFDPSASEMIVNPLYNRAGKVLGVDTAHDWNRYYEKVRDIVSWAKEETKYTDEGKLIDWIYNQLGKTSSLGNKKIDDLYIYSKLKTPGKPKTKTVVKTVIKKVYVKEKLKTEDMINRIVQGY